MCEYLSQIEQACEEFAERGVAFDILQIRDRVRELVGTGINVSFRPVKYEVLAFFERGGIPGFVLSTKRIVKPSPEFWEGEGNDTSGTLQSVFNIVPLTDIIETAKPDPIQVSLHDDKEDAIGPMPW